MNKYFLLGLGLKAFLLLLLLTADLAAQDRLAGYCGTDMGRSAWLQNYQRNPGAVARTTDTLYLPVQIHRVSESNGEGAVSIGAMIEKMCILNGHFSELDMQFYIAGISNISDDQLYNHSNFNVSQKLIQHNVANRINIYFVENSGGSCGYWIPVVDAIVLSIDRPECLLGNVNATISHEMGHFLSLPHTFHGWEDIVEPDYSIPAQEAIFYRGKNVPVEKVDGSNCAIASDGFCDTEPDYINYRWSCNGGTTSSEIQLDPDSVAFTSVAAYIMGYSYDACQFIFSEGQQLAMRANATEQRSNLISIPSPELLAPPMLSELSLQEPTNGTTTTYYDSVRLTWTPVTAALGYSIELNIINDFSQGAAISYFSENTTLLITEGLSPNRRYYWRIVPLMSFANCTEYTYPVRNFRTSATSPVLDPALSGALKIYPNPVGNGLLVLELNDGSLRGNLDYEFLDRLGRVVRRGNIGNFTTTRIDVSGLPQGMYFLRARADGRLATKKIVVR